MLNNGYLKTIFFYWFIGIIISCASRTPTQITSPKIEKVDTEVLHSYNKKDHMDHSFLLGKWQGEVMTNSSDLSGGGTPTLGETGTQVQIHLFKSDKGLKGRLDIGQTQEQWQFIDELHIWSDKNIKVITQAIAEEQVPNWIKNKILGFKYDHLMMFKFQSCTKLNSDRACHVKKDLPEGIVNKGVWVFMAQGKSLYVNVYYSYPSGGKRILEQKLSRR